MNNCVSKNSADFKSLYKEVFGIDNIDAGLEQILAVAISSWQDENGLDKWPLASDMRNSMASPATKAYIKDKTSGKGLIKPGVAELFESNPELANEVYEALGLNIINESEITYTDEEGNLCAKMGLTNATKGTGWKIVKDFKGQPKHSQGGVDITISDNGISMRRGGKDIKAKFGLLIAANGLNMNNPDIPPFDEWYKTVPKEKNDTTSYNLRRAYELAPREQLDAFINDKDVHLYSVYENPESGEYEFMKSKNHPTLKYEIDWYNSEEGKEFRDNYDLDTSGEYYKYIPKNKTNEKN